MNSIAEIPKNIRFILAKTNIDIGIQPKLKFLDEVKKYSYMWKAGGEYSK